jgi:hypothetical protein
MTIKEVGGNVKKVPKVEMLSVLHGVLDENGNPIIKDSYMSEKDDALLEIFYKHTLLSEEQSRVIRSDIRTGNYRLFFEEYTIDDVLIEILE